MKKESLLHKRFKMPPVVVQFVILYFVSYAMAGLYDPDLLNGSKWNVFKLTAIVAGCVIFANGIAVILDQIKTWLKDV